MPSPNRAARPEGQFVDVLVLHYTGMRTAAEAVARLRDPIAAVSSHYVVDEDGAILGLVPEAERASHAGVSWWRGMAMLNDRSIGIEIVNPGHEWGYRPFPPAQIGSVIALCSAIRARHPIPPVHVVGHSDVAPDRKQDPGELFPWDALAAAGICIETPATMSDPLDADPADPAALAASLVAIGYPPMPLPIVATAFKRRWRPGRVDGAVDRGTLAVADAVRAAYEGAAPLARSSEQPSGAAFASPAAQNNP